MLGDECRWSPESSHGFRRRKQHLAPGHGHGGHGWPRISRRHHVGQQGVDGRAYSLDPPRSPLPTRSPPKEVAAGVSHSHSQICGWTEHRPMESPPLNGARSVAFLPVGVPVEPRHAGHAVQGASGNAKSKAWVRPFASA